MSRSLVRIVRPALYVEAANALRERLFDGELAPGDWIDEAALALEMGISRTPLREALKLLAAEGLVQLQPRRGCYVTELTERDLDEIFPVIALLEGRCAHEAALKAGADELASLEVLHERLVRHAQARRINAYYETNYEIHEAIIRLAGNRRLAQLITEQRRLLRLARHRSLKLPGRLEASLSEHLAIFAALKARDPQGAEMAMRTHLTRQHEALSALAGQAAGRSRRRVSA